MSMILELAAIVWGGSFCAIVTIGILCGVSANVRRRILGKDRSRSEQMSRLEL